MAKKSKTDNSDLVDEPASIGHNSMSKVDLYKIVEHLEGLIEERSNLSEAISDAMAVAKAKGFDTKTIREMLKLRAMDSEKRREKEQLRDMYLVALGLAE
jgi:uncharacterized protein (UPF0335 family)